jgi:hypothetical protein
MEGAASAEEPAAAGIGSGLSAPGRERMAHPAEADAPRLVNPPFLARWKSHLDLYREKRALIFKNDKDLDAAIDLLWGEELYELPHALAGGDTIIVPAEAVRFFKEKGLTFRNTRVRSAGDLPPGEINKLRREQGPY